MECWKFLVCLMLKARGYSEHEYYFFSSPPSSSLFLHNEGTFKEKHSVMKLLPSLFGCLALHRALAQISQDPGTPSPAVPPKALESTTLQTSVINKLNFTPGNVTLDNDLVDSDTATDFDENDPEHVATSDSDDNDGEHNPLDTFESEIDFDNDNVAMGNADGKKPLPDDDEGQAIDDEGGKKSKKEKKKDKEDQVKISFYRFKKKTADHCQKLHRNFHSYRLKPKSHHKHKIHKKNKDDDSDSGDESDVGVNCTLHVYTDKHCNTEVFASAVELGNCTNVNNDHGNTGYLHRRDLAKSAGGPEKGKGKGKGKGKHPHKKGDYNSVMVTCLESDTGYDSETASNSTKKGDPDVSEPESEDEGGHDGEYATFSSASATGLHSYKDHTTTESAKDVEETSSSRSHHDEDGTSKFKHHKSITDSESTGTRHHESTTDVEPTSSIDIAKGISRTTKEAEGTGQSSRTVTHVMTSTKEHRHIAASGKALYASGLASYAASLSKYAVSMSSDPDLPYITFPSGTELPTQTGSVSETTRAPAAPDSTDPEDNKKDKTKQEKDGDEGQETENEGEHDKKDDDEKLLP
ncbi:hypothetical protein E4T38_03072 [Aureobasidium subglaciale]|nr:hypothetical protein E4T38_03072 [Aureobasidium subglaciale]KAI5226847.1 hypothetical protein E4T40_02846 [Aureobasidium subglaciale]KAI5230138.1 hypothetical protein E4T41_03069 [Aureobasidium subglaciale]KAI5264669.1 hypothetical protein E4T46_02847 [Aureobasidium subglaciale]